MTHVGYVASLLYYLRLFQPEITSCSSLFLSSGHFTIEWNGTT